MRARFIKPLFANLDRGAAHAGAAPLRAVSTATDRGQAAPPQSAKGFDDGSIKVRRDDEIAIEERREPSLSIPQPTSHGGIMGVQGDDQPVAAQRAEPLLSPPRKTSDRGFIKVVRDDKDGAEAPLHQRTAVGGESSVEARSEPSISTSPKSSEDSDQKLAPNTKIAIEDLEREHEFRTALELMTKGPRRTRTDEIDTKAIILIAAGVIVLGVVFTSLLPAILTRDAVEPAAALVTSPAPATAEQTERTEAVQAAPAPAPAQLPQAAPPPPAPSASTSVAKTAPALRGSSPPEAKIEGRATEQVLVPSASKTAPRSALSAAEQAAVTRGLQELEKRPAVAAAGPRAAARPALTAEEQAAVERGLRELEKADQAKP